MDGLGHCTPNLFSHDPSAMNPSKCTSVDVHESEEGLVACPLESLELPDETRTPSDAGDGPLALGLLPTHAAAK